MCMPGKFASALLNQLAPCACILCGQASGRDVPLCRNCQDELPCNESACPRCAIPLVDSGGQPCGDCQRRPPPFTSTLAPYRYTRPVDSFIKQLKFSADLCQLPLLAELMWEPVAQTLLSQGVPDFLIPVPLHWRRQWQRGFNQATLLAQQLCNHPQLRPWSLRVGTTVCTRRRATSAQAGLDSAQRQRNIRNAFACKKNVVDQHLVIIDDVMTTGSTVRALATELLRAGARRVDVWCCARTPGY